MEAKNTLTYEDDYTLVVVTTKRVVKSKDLLMPWKVCLLSLLDLIDVLNNTIIFIMAPMLFNRFLAESPTYLAVQYLNNIRG